MIKTEGEYNNRDQPTINLTDQQSSQMLRDVHRALIGDPLNPDEEPGLVRTLMSVRDDLNGTKSSPIGIRQKVETMWCGRAKLIWMCAGATCVVAFVSWIVPLLVNLYLARPNYENPKSSPNPVHSAATHAISGTSGY